MKLHKLTCPNCSGTLDMDIAKGTTSVFCPYCGQQFLLDDEKKEYTINKNININKSIHNRYTDDAEVIKAINQEKENKRSTWVPLIAIAILMIMSISCFLIPGLIERLTEQAAIDNGKISAGYYKDLLDEDYKTVEAHFIAAGFTNIELIDLNDSGLAFWTDGKVKTISVGGDTSFDSYDYFYPDTKVVISYH